MWLPSITHKWREGFESINKSQGFLNIYMKSVVVRGPIITRDDGLRIRTKNASPGKGGSISVQLQLVVENLTPGNIAIPGFQKQPMCNLISQRARNDNTSGSPDAFPIAILISFKNKRAAGIAREKKMHFLDKRWRVLTSVEPERRIWRSKERNLPFYRQ